MSYIGSTPTTQSFIAGTDYFNGTGSAVNFTLSRSVNSVNDIEVIVNNVEQIPSGYSVSGTTLTFSAAPSAGTSNVYVRYLSTTNLSLAIPAGTSATFNTVTATTLAVTGVTTFAAGTAALPAITTTGDTNTGIFFPAADTIGFSEGGAEAARFNASGVFTTTNDATIQGLTVGRGAGAVATNTAVGASALQANTTASNNTAVGYQAGYTSTGQRNAFFGSEAGYANTTGESNTYIGRQAGNLMTSGSNNTIIGRYNGNQGSLDIRTSSNYIVLSDGDGNPRGFFNADGYLKVAPSAGDLNGITGTYHEIVTASAGGNALRLRQANASFNDTIFRVASNRNTTNNTYYFMDCLDSGGTAKFRVADSGNVTNTNNSYGSISDAKLKENVTDATPKLDKLNQVRIVNYNLIGDEKKQLGVIAQELEQIFPSMVDETPDRDEEGNDLGTTTKSVKYSVFVPMLIKAMQEQQALIQALTTRITALEAA
jgi:hypothetical protein